LKEIGTIDTMFQILLYDWEKDGKHIVVGSLFTTLRELSFSPANERFLFDIISSLSIIVFFFFLN